jgi:putative transcriptional regulator
MDTEFQSELASLFALDALDESEQCWVANQYADLPEFEAEAAEAQTLTALMSYTAEPLPLPTKLKERLVQRIAAANAASKLSHREAIAVEALAEQARLAEWQPYLPTPGVEFATLRLDSETREIEYFVRSLGQVKFPQHRHAGTEEIIVLSGDLKIVEQVYRRGDRIYSDPATIHQPETLNGCTLLVRTSLDDELL